MKKIALKKIKEGQKKWVKRRSKYKRDKYGHILREVDEKTEEIETSNSFDVLNYEKNELQEKSSNNHKKESIKDWLNKTFSKSEENIASKEQTSKEVNVK